MRVVECAVRSEPIDPRAKKWRDPLVVAQAASESGLRWDKEATMQMRGISKVSRWACLAVALAFAAPTVASAQPGPAPGAKERREKRKERREEAKEKRKERREEAKENREEIKEKRDELREKRKELHEARRDGATPEERHKRRREVVEARKDLNKARREARQDAKKALRERLAHGKNRAKKAVVTAELRRHARITARLARAHEVAEKAENKDAMTRIDALMAKENARHSQWLNKHAPEN